MGLFKKIASVASPLSGAGGIPGFGSLGNLLRGKQVTDPASPLAGDIRALQAEGIGLQKEGLKALKDPSAGLGAQIAREQKGIRAAGEDAQRRNQALIAQRGLGRSSIGTSMQNQAFQNTANQLAANKASFGERLRGRQLEGLQAGSQLTAAAPIRMQAKTRRVGGIGQLLGTGLGAAFGGAAGAQIGGGIGGALQYS